MFIFDFNWQIQSFLNQFWYQINFLLLVILVILGYLAYKKPAYAVGLTIILLPTYLFRSKIWFLPFTYLELCIWVTFLVPFIKSLLTKSYHLQPTSYFLKWPILLIIIASTIGVILSPDKTAAAGLWKAYFIEPLLFYLILINVLKTQKDKEILLWSLGISTLVISLLAIYQKFTGFGIAEAGWVAAEHRRVTSIFTSPNAIGLYLGPILAIYFGWLLSEIKNFKATILKLLIIIPSILAVIFTVSQGTWLGLAAAIVFLAFFGWNKPAHQNFWCAGKKWTTLIVLVLIITCLVIPITQHQVLDLITLQDTSGQNRLILLQMSWQHLLTNPLNFIFGAGINGFAQIQDQLRDPLKMEALLYPHNILLNFWLEIGLLGLIAFVWIIIKFFKTGFRSSGLGARGSGLLILGVLAAMITILVHGLIDVPYFKNDLAVLFWVIIGLL
ncbi:MAG: O-antigen ligase family protein [Patescibacteria group bacterium]|jgi:O-antigen ligase